MTKNPLGSPRNSYGLFPVTMRSLPHPGVGRLVLDSNPNFPPNGHFWLFCARWIVEHKHCSYFLNSLHPPFLTSYGTGGFFLDVVFIEGFVLFGL